MKQPLPETKNCRGAFLHNRSGENYVPLFLKNKAAFDFAHFHLPFLPKNYKMLLIKTKQNIHLLQGVSNDDEEKENQRVESSWLHFIFAYLLEIKFRKLMQPVSNLQHVSIGSGNHTNELEMKCDL